WRYRVGGGGNDAASSSGSGAIIRTLHGRPGAPRAAVTRTPLNPALPAHSGPRAAHTARAKPPASPGGQNDSYTESLTPAALMSGGNRPVRRIGTRAVVRQEASIMAESDASSSSDPAPSAAPSSDASESSTNMEPKLELKLEPMDLSPPTPAETPELPPPPIITMPTMPMNATTALQLKENLLLQPLGPMAFAGRKRKANFSNEETETLVRDVVTHFSALYGSEALRTESTRRNQRRSQLWTQIQKNVNELGYTPRSIDDLKHKWRDLRLEVKRKITQRKTGTKVPPVPGVAPIIDTNLTAMEDLVASTIGHHCTLDGEQEGMYMEPGVPRQSIFFTCRGEMGGDMVGSIANCMVRDNSPFTLTLAIGIEYIN
ncbi:unnamed protein product, partial [Ranitomeya imitator]